MITRRTFGLGAASLAASTHSTPSLAQAPSGTHRIVVGFPPGGSADTLARLLVEQLKAYAPTWIVDNRPGAGGRIALDHLKNSTPDGTAMILTPASMQVLYPHVYKQLSYDPVADFQPVSSVCSSAFSLTVGPRVPTGVKTVADFVEWCKANPKESGYGTSGAGSMTHFAGVMFAREANFDFVHIPYKGAAAAIQDLLGGHVAANLSVISNALPSIQSGQLRSLATTGTKRSTFLPDVPTLVEAGFKNLAIEEWFGVFLPSKTPGAVVLALNAAIRAAIKTKPFQDSLSKFSFSDGGEGPAEFSAMMKTDLARWQPIVKASGFTPAD